MIIPFEQLARYRQQVAMVDGCFDPLHKGHITYFRAAAEGLGVPVLCNLAADDYVRTKHVPFLPEDQRAAIIDAIRYVAYTHINRATTADVLRELQPRYYVKGKDWEGRLPPEQVEIARTCSIAIIYLDTVEESSTELLDRFLQQAWLVRRTG